MSFLQSDATDQTEAIKRGDISPVEATTIAVERIEALNPRLNAVITPMFEPALEHAARTPLGNLTGVPILVKDLGDEIQGVPYHEGSRFLQARSWHAPHDAITIRRLEAAGAVICGRTNTCEFGLLPATEPKLYGPTRNPWDRKLSPGGSSGGSAAAVAARLVALATGSDTGGSVRIPAALCGVLGYKPTGGLIPQAPGGPPGATVDLATRGILARSTRDVALALTVLRGAEAGTRGRLTGPHAPLRIGVVDRRPDGGPVSAECRTAVHTAARVLGEQGHTVVLVRLPAPDEHETMRRHYGRMTSAALLHRLRSWGHRLRTPITQHDVEPLTWWVAERARTRRPEAVAQADRWLRAWSERLATWWDASFDLLLCPVLPFSTMATGHLADDDPWTVMERVSAVVAFTTLANVTGRPAIALPVGLTDAGLPVGVQLIGRAGHDGELLACCHQLEGALTFNPDPHAQRAGGSQLPTESLTLVHDG